ncbi:hypothetical protein A8C32_05840 [Flavivirga aquatica]|uniref:Uncharacterized protein n=1 Tax=Flavivirga aquatica TaxID=1849968 RepID=A0A1E5SHX9_9FLAO|nr:hypothetical protein [Flavivirga aquatica]OEJ98718.1 hypothetical protein A8C32_05840 [Flavivirga aquatica]
MVFTDEKIEEIWKKGTVVSGNKPNEYRKDQCGVWIAKNQYGNRKSKNMAKPDGKLVCTIVIKRC